MNQAEFTSANKDKFISTNEDKIIFADEDKIIFQTKWKSTPPTKSIQLRQTDSYWNPPNQGHDPHDLQ